MYVLPYGFTHKMHGLWCLKVKEKNDFRFHRVTVITSIFLYSVTENYTKNHSSFRQPTGTMSYSMVETENMLQIMIFRGND